MYLCMSSLKSDLQLDNGLTSTAASTDVKVEASPSVLTPQDVPANDGDFLQGVQMILVKAEDQQISNDPHISQEAQHTHRNSSLGKDIFFD